MTPRQILKLINLKNESHKRDGFLKKVGQLVNWMCWSVEISLFTIFEIRHTADQVFLGIQFLKSVKIGHSHARQVFIFKKSHGPKNEYFFLNHLQIHSFYFIEHWTFAKKKVLNFKNIFLSSKLFLTWWKENNFFSFFSCFDSFK